MAYLFVIWIPVGEDNLQKDNEVDDELYSSVIGSAEDKSIQYMSLQKLLKGVLHRLKVTKYDWRKSQDGCYMEVLFVVEKEETDLVLEHLYKIGIGSIANTSVSIFLSNYHNKGEVANNEAVSDIAGEEQKRKSEFIKSVKARLTVAQVVEAVKITSTLTFDFILYVVIASMISVVGFIEDSPVILIVSILLAPLMGPLLAAIFGIMIKNSALWKLGIKNLVISLLICVCIGLGFGLVASGINHNGVKWSGDTAWPTSMMRARGIPHSLWVGMLVSLPTGAGVALSVLGGTSGPLVGVAVSASLLGPICNAGLFFAVTIVSSISPPTTVQNSTTYTSKLNCTPLQDNDYQFYYTCHMGLEALYLGLVSLTGTVIDILCMFVMGFIILKIKEVAPNTPKSDTFDMFWKTDIKVARKAYEKMEIPSTSQADLARDIAKEEKKNRLTVLPSVIMNLEEDRHYRKITDSLPIRPPELDDLLDNGIYSDVYSGSRRQHKRVMSNLVDNKAVSSYLSKTNPVPEQSCEYELTNKPV